MIKFDAKIRGIKPVAGYFRYMLYVKIDGMGRFVKLETQIVPEFYPNSKDNSCTPCYWFTNEKMFSIDKYNE